MTHPFVAAVAAVADTAANGVMIVESGVLRYANLSARDSLASGAEAISPVLAGIVDAARRSGFWSGAVTDPAEVPGELVASAWMVDAGTGSDIAMVVVSRTPAALDPPADVDLRDVSGDVQRRAQEQRVVSALHRISVTGSADHLANAILETVPPLFDAEHVLILRPVPDGESMAVLGATGRTTRELEGMQVRASGIAGYVMREGTPVVCVDTARETRFDASEMRRYGLRSAAAVPVPGSPENWGVLAVYRESAGVVTPDALTVLIILADVLGAAVHRTDLEHRLRHRSRVDPVTSLDNRTSGYRRLDDALAAGRDDGRLTAVVLIDLDGFRSVNETFGFAAGDALLAAVAPVISGAARRGDAVARLGADQFAVICPGLTSTFEATDLATSVLAALAEPFSVEGRGTVVTACAGVAVGHGNRTAADLVREADIAVAAAKRRGPGHVEVFDAAAGGALRRRWAVATDLRAAIDADDLTVVYQPVFDIEIGVLVGVEALARWTSPTLGPLGPDEFVPAAEQAGLIAALGERVLRRACRDAVAWHRLLDGTGTGTGDGSVGSTAPTVDLRVNVSPLQLRTPGFLATVDDALADSGLDPSTFGIEITESVWLEDSDTVRSALRGLHERGIRILLDDFGVGHSSLGSVTRFPLLDGLKIDRSFVAELSVARSEAVVGAMVSLAEAFGLDVIGEGVETSEQLATLRRCGCRLAQGYLLGRPTDADSVAALVRAGGVLAAPGPSP
ncbi:putative bifunctional diguanylate cyclase/phosphodiesterase [Rhodococcoides corynebacterioides]|uniref:putative bifunctional diguanylate cyclase/phosphodiesterase n=1 Tax=Rhodococcoides corynebacterioides TaxID=53972 RepID=UPI001C9A984B|nr:EAL domain-containing protein [Rhodococcus corynebacterioides]MBY6363881.1 EAL domain-containing protein [Rhodococcus corynebacterioides]